MADSDSGTPFCKTRTGVPPAVLRLRMERSKLLRKIIKATEISMPVLASALRVQPSVLEDWTEGLDLASSQTALVIEHAFERWSELESASPPAHWPDFGALVTRYAKAAHLPGFR